MSQINIDGLTVQGQHGPRPVVTEAMKLAAALPIANEMIPESREAESAAKDIAECGSMGKDGYEIAKSLESEGWDITREDIDTLDGYAYNLRQELEKAEQEWAEVNDIQPSFPIGTRVILQHDGEGEITGVYKHGPAKYEVRPDSNSERADACNSRRIINFEDAKAV